VVLLFFAAVLLFSSFKLLAAGDEDADEDADLSQNFIVKTCKCVACTARHVMRTVRTKRRTPANAAHLSIQKPLVQ